MASPKTVSASQVIGVAPMAGRGTRLGLSVSKELAVLNFASSATSVTTPDFVSPETGETLLSEIMLRRMGQAGIREAVLTIASRKQDIRDHFGERFVYRPAQEVARCSLALYYAYAENSRDTPTSIDAAYPLTQGRVCALGFADILYSECPGYRRALGVLNSSPADVVLGLFPTAHPARSDMVAFDARGRVTDILIKQSAGARFAYTWGLAVWRPAFTDFLHSWVATRAGYAASTNEHYVGDVVLAAMQVGMRVDAVVVSSLANLDAGTPETLALARDRRW